MSKNRYIIHTILLFIVLFLTSCKKYLDKAPDTLYAYPTTVSNLQDMLNNTTVLNEYLTPSFMEVSADDIFLQESTYNSLSQAEREAYSWEVPTVNDFNDWGKPYGAIFTANVAIEQIDKIKRTPANGLEWDKVKGSAYFFRAYYFSELVWTFSKAYEESTADTDLGIVLRKTTDINERSIRASLAESYQQIISDASESIVYLPDLPSHSLQPSKAAAYALLARVYLSMRKYSDALNYATLCLNIKKDLINYNGDVDIASDINQVSPPFRKYNKEILFYSETSNNLGLYLPLYAYIDTALTSSYSNDDLRKSAFFIGSGTFKRFKGSYSQSDVKMFSGIATDEVYLIRAEALARLANKQGALDNLNILLKQRWRMGTFAPLDTISTTNVLERILSERRKELLMRNLRWIDIKRLNKENLGIVLKRKIGLREMILNPNDNRYALPIPIQIINITGMPQNPR